MRILILIPVLLLSVPVLAGDVEIVTETPENFKKIIEEIDKNRERSVACKDYAETEAFFTELDSMNLIAVPDGYDYEVFGVTQKMSVEFDGVDGKLLCSVRVIPADKIDMYNEDQKKVIQWLKKRREQLKRGETPDPDPRF